MPEQALVGEDACLLDDRTPQGDLRLQVCAERLRRRLALREPKCGELLPA